jgi:hypothetical protein
MTAYTCRIEADVKKYIKKILDKHGWFWWMPPANGYGKAGVSDFGAVHNGVFVVIEAKHTATNKGQPTPMQIGYLNSVRAEQCFAFVVNENRLDDLDAWLGAFARAAASAARGEKPSDEDGAVMINAMREMQSEL